MKLDQETIEWIEEATAHIDYGEARLIISDKRIVKIITEYHKTKERMLDKKP